MKKLFGTKKKQAPVQKGPSLGETTSKLGERGKVIQNKIDEQNKQLAEIKMQMKGQKGLAYKSSQKRAMQVLKRRRMYQQQLDNLMSQQYNIDQVQFASENIQTTIDTAAAMKEATAMQKVQMQKINLDELEDVHEDMRDMLEDQEEINEVLCRDYALDGYDENELLGELDELDEEIVSEKMDEGMGVPSYLPNQPNQAVAAKKEEDELAALMN